MIGFGVPLFWVWLASTLYQKSGAVTGPVAVFIFTGILVSYWVLLLVAVGAAAEAWHFYLATAEGRYRWDRLKLRIPVVGRIVLKASLARFARSFAIAFHSGVPVVNALSVVAQVVDNAFIGQRVEQMRDGVERGESVSRTAAATGVFTPTVLQMIAVGEESGELDGLNRHASCTIRR